jgi:hypothetical protein
MLANHAAGGEPVIREFLRPAVRAIPRPLAARVGPCRIRLHDHLANAEIRSLSTRTGGGLEIDLACAETDPHDLAMELLLCVGLALWDEARPAKREAYLKLLLAETEAGVAGEIDEESLRQKRRLLLSPASARNPRRLERYARASFASTAAEYVHCLWHDVHTRAGPDHLPAEWLRRRLLLFARWFPPDRGYRLFG